MKSLAMHITNQKLSFDIFTVGNLQNIFMEHDIYLIPIILTHTMYFWLLLQIYLCFVLQGHISEILSHKINFATQKQQFKEHNYFTMVHVR